MVLTDEHHSFSFVNTMSLEVWFGNSTFSMQSGSYSFIVGKWLGSAMILRLVIGYFSKVVMVEWLESSSAICGQTDCRGSFLKNDIFLTLELENIIRWSVFVGNVQNQKSRMFSHNSFNFRYYLSPRWLVPQLPRLPSQSPMWPYKSSRKCCERIKST